jgi:CheY-like chemotaxis protein
MKIKLPNYKYNNVLLIDDNMLDNFINEKLLEAEHFSKKIYTCTSAKSAIEFLNNISGIGSQTYPDVLFVDINMPIMDGFQFIELFKKELESKMNNPKIVVLTSSVFPEDKQRATVISDEITYINKPLDRNILVSI